MSEKSTERAATDSARRRLIRGAFAAPASLTLCSGSAFAMTSNQRCVAQQVNSSPVYPGGTSVDLYVRVPRYKQGSDYFVQRSDVALVLGTATSFFGSTSAWGAKIAAPPVLVSSQPSGLQSGYGYVALLVDASGHVVGIDTGSMVAGSSAVAKSCWTSFSGAARVPGW